MLFMIITNVAIITTNFFLIKPTITIAMLIITTPTKFTTIDSIIITITITLNLFFCLFDEFSLELLVIPHLASASMVFQFVFWNKYQSHRFPRQTFLIN